MHTSRTSKPVSIFELPGPPAKQGAVQVLTPLGASVLFGRSGEAVRRAAREGLVRTRLALAFTAKQVRLLDYQSCFDYWGENPWPSYRRRLDVELREMRRYGITFLYAGTEYQVLHPYPIAAQGASGNHLDDLE